MNLESVSQVAFIEYFQVAPAHTARVYFASLPHGASYAARLAHVLCSGHLLAQLESVCMEAMHEAIDWENELVLGASMSLQHCGPATVGDYVEMRGMVIGIDPRRVRFHVEASVAGRAVASGEVHFAIVERVRHTQRLDSAVVAVYTAPEWTPPPVTGVKAPKSRFVHDLN